MKVRNLGSPVGRAVSAVLLWQRRACRRPETVYWEALQQPIPLAFLPNLERQPGRRRVRTLPGINWSASRRLGYRLRPSGNAPPNWSGHSLPCAPRRPTRRHPLLRVLARVTSAILNTVRLDGQREPAGVAIEPVIEDDLLDPTRGRQSETKLTQISFAKPSAAKQRRPADLTPSGRPTLDRPRRRRVDPPAAWSRGP